MSIQLLYANDYDGWILPAANTDYNATANCDTSLFVPNGKVMNRNYHQAMVFYGYRKSSDKTFFCESMVARVPVSDLTSNGYYGYGYGVVDYQVSSSQWQFKQNGGRIQYCNGTYSAYYNTKKYSQPGSLIMFGESVRRNKDYSSTELKPGAQYAPYAWDEHRKGLWNSAFLDGHVKAADRGDLKNSLFQCAWFGKNSVGDPMQL